MRLHILADVVVQLLAFRIEIWVIEIQEDLAFLYAPAGDWIIGIRRVEYWTTIRLESREGGIWRVLGYGEEYPDGLD